MTRGEGRGVMGENKGRSKQRNTYKGLMDMENGEELTVEDSVEESSGEKVGQL